MAIIEEYDAIAKRLRELRSASPKGANEIDLERWRDIARETARVYVESRRERATGKPVRSRGPVRLLDIGG